MTETVDFNNTSWEHFLAALPTPSIVDPCLPELIQLINRAEQDEFIPFDESKYAVDTLREKIGGCGFPNIGTPLSYAAAAGNLNVVRWLTNERKATSRSDPQGYTPLLWASLNGHLEVVKYLLQSGCSEITESSKDGNTALLVGTIGGHQELVSWLVEEGGSVVAEMDLLERTPLLLAALGGHFSIVQWLIQVGGSQVDEADVDGNTALLFAIPDLDLVKFLVGAGANVNQGNVDGCTPVMTASKDTSYEVLEFLLLEGWLTTLQLPPNNTTNNILDATAWALPKQVEAHDEIHPDMVHQLALHGWLPPAEAHVWSVRTHHLFPVVFQLFCGVGLWCCCMQQQNTCCALLHELVGLAFTFWSTDAFSPRLLALHQHLLTTNCTSARYEGGL
eukprot:TRINITY_DN102943_c0_g1_i1.p1 TRINITY_DN102943_c0_g1~~TRINITY_DN102943_c0_g1_i1.p1  ORF type:complete len:391 (+),score=34.81 TRINITY_DN102943_c0_g1_i1:3-1175(+)